MVPPVWVQPGNSGYPRERHRIMNVLLVGTGTVGEAIAHLVKGRKWLGRLTLADYSLKRARHVADAVGAGYEVAQVDAGNAPQLKELIAASKANLVLNAVDPRFVPAVFDAALEDPAFAGLERASAPLATLEEMTRVHPAEYIETILGVQPAPGVRESTKCEAWRLTMNVARSCAGGCRLSVEITDCNSTFRNSRLMVEVSPG